MYPEQACDEEVLKQNKIQTWQRPALILMPFLLADFNSSRNLEIQNNWMSMFTVTVFWNLLRNSIAVLMVYVNCMSRTVTIKQKSTGNSLHYKQRIIIRQFTWDINGMWIRVYGLMSLMRTCVRMFRSRSFNTHIHTVIHTYTLSRKKVPLYFRL